MESITKYDVRLVKESSNEYEYDKNALNDHQAVAKMLNEIFDLENRCEEHFVMLALDTKLKVVGAFDIHAGTAKASLVSAKSVFTRAMLCNANSIIIAHNHPSGAIDPSKDDVDVTRTIEKAGKILDIRLLDHIIIGDGDCYSFKQNKWL